MVGVALRLPIECGFLVLQFSLSLNYFLVRWLGSVHETASDVYGPIESLYYITSHTSSAIEQTVRKYTCTGNQHNIPLHARAESLVKGRARDTVLIHPLVRLK